MRNSDEVRLSSDKEPRVAFLSPKPHRRDLRGVFVEPCSTSIFIEYYCNTLSLLALSAFRSVPMVT